VDALALTDEQIEDVKGRDLVFGFLINNIADDFSKTLASSGEKHAEDYGIELGSTAATSTPTSSSASSTRWCSRRSTASS
jgi:hypothetical protein